jgi:hypothetical protein
MTDQADGPPDDRKVSTTATERVDPIPSPPDADADEPTGEEYFLFDEGHTARILTLDEVAAVTEGRYVPDGASGDNPRRSERVSSSPDAGAEPSADEFFEFVSPSGRVLTLEEVMDIVEGRAEPPD